MSLSITFMFKSKKEVSLSEVFETFYTLISMDQMCNAERTCTVTHNEIITDFTMRTSLDRVDFILFTGSFLPCLGHATYYLHRIVK